MIRRRAAVLMVGLVPLLAGCPGQPGSAPAPSGAAAPAAPAAPASWTTSMLGALNAQRAQAGAAPLSLCGTLVNAAQGHSADQAAHRTMTHTGSDGSTIGVRAGRAGYNGWTSLGENVAYGYPTVDAVMAGWMNSPGHRANILNPSYTHVGLGRAAAGSTEYWTQDFGRSGTC